MIGASSTYDVLVIGGGVVGLSVLRSATLAGWKCALIESNPNLLTGASGSNSGIACTGVDASPGTLERALIRDSISQLRPYCREHNIPIRPCGSLVCQWPWDVGQTEDTSDALAAVLDESWEAGDAHASRLSPGGVLNLEPNLASSCLGAIHIPGEVVVDPWLLSVSYAVHARENGAEIFTDFSMDTEKTLFDEAEQHWTLYRKVDDEMTPASSSTLPSFLKARAIVNAAGIHADVVQASLLSLDHPPTWEARPRRGQYRIFSSRAETRIDHPIQPVPTQFSKGVFVFSTLYDQIVVGPTALDQQSRTDRTADPQVAESLTAHVQRILPELQPDSECVGEYVGIRPGSNHRDYQVHLSPRHRWISAAGIRSTGLTASLGVGRHIVDLLRAVLAMPEPLGEIITTAMPDISELVEEYHSRSDQKVTIHGYEYLVTHPLTRLGWKAKTGLAEP